MSILLEKVRVLTFGVKKLASNKGVLSVVDQLIYSGGSFFMALFLGRYLEAEQFGLFLIMLSILLFVFFLQKGACVEFLFVKGVDSKNNDIGYFFSVQFLFSCFVLVFVFLVIVLLNMIAGAEIEHGAFVLAVYLLSWREFFRAINIYRLNISRLILFDFLYAFLLVTMLVVLYIEDQLFLGNVWIVIALSAGFLIIMDLFLDEINFSLLFGRGFNLLIRNNLRFIAFNAFINVMIWAYANAYRFIILFLLGPVIVAAIGACNYLVQLSSPIINGLQNYYLVKVSRSKLEDKAKVKREAAISIMLVSVLFSFPLIFSPVWLLELFFGDNKYNEFSLFVQFYGVSLIITSAGRLFHFGLLLNNSADRLAVAYIVSLPLSIVVLVMSVHLYGVNGMLVYILASSFLFAIITYFVFTKTDNRKTI